LSARCAFCGKDELLPFQCPFCNMHFCMEHRLPENHNCAEAPQRTPLGSWQAKQRGEKPIESQTGVVLSAGELGVIVQPKCPKFDSRRTMLLATRPGFSSYECLKCRKKWKMSGGDYVTSNRDVGKKSKKKRKRFGVF